MRRPGSLTIVARVALAALAALGAGACGSTQPRAYVQKAEVRVETGGSKPIDGARVLVNGEQVESATAKGSAFIAVRGLAGDRFNVTAACPEGFRAAQPPMQDVYVMPSLDGPPPRIAFRCDSATRQATVTVHADGGPDLPVRYLGRELGTTDAKGLATVTIDVQEGDTFELVLDTSKSKKQLHPQNPALTFRIGPHDDSFAFDQKFTVEKAKAAARVAPRVPKRLSPDNP